MINTLTTMCTRHQLHVHVDCPEIDTATYSNIITVVAIKVYSVEQQQTKKVTNTLVPVIPIFIYSLIRSNDIETIVIHLTLQKERSKANEVTFFSQS